jgi:peptide deformylase
MVHPIVLYGSPMLRKSSREIQIGHQELKELVTDMFETMHVSDGIGLAAPQIGKSLRIFVVDATPMKEDDPSLDGFKKVFINPRIVEETGERWTYKEGCLSLPGLHEDVDRHSSIRIQYFDEEFNFHDEKYDGVKARVMQHEYDHLDGVLFIDRISPLKKKLIKGKLNDIAKGKAKAAYKTRIVK